MAQEVILLVEDNPDDEALTMRAFRKHNVANPVVVARDGQEAIDYMFGAGAHQGRDPRDIPAVVLLDLRLPKVDGIEVLRRIRSDERTRRTPVVVLTSSDEERDLVAAYNEGVNSYVRKPVGFEEFIEAVQQLHLYWMILNEPPPRSR